MCISLCILSQQFLFGWPNRVLPTLLRVIWYLFEARQSLYCRNQVLVSIQVKWYIVNNLKQQLNIFTSLCHCQQQKAKYCENGQNTNYRGIQKWWVLWANLNLWQAACSLSIAISILNILSLFGVSHILLYATVGWPQHLSSVSFGDHCFKITSCN